MAESFPRQSARTRRFTLGEPRSFALARDGSRFAFVRSRSGDDAVNCLWVMDPKSGAEHLVADPRELLGEGEDNLPPAERARRERARESAGGVVTYGADRDLRVAALALAGQLFVADLDTGDVERRDVAGPVFDPRPDPTGARIAHCASTSLFVDGSEVAGDDDPNVVWGQAEFIAAEEMGRTRGYWWAPDGTRLAVARVDLSPVRCWHIADPAQPAHEPTAIPYPAAGTANADVSLHLVGADGRGRLEVRWERERFPYLVEVVWQRDRPLTLLVQSRDQRDTRVLTVDDATGSTTVVAEQHDEQWVDIVPGVPAWLDDGRLVMTADSEDTRRVTIDGAPVTPVGLQMRRIIDVGVDVLFAATSNPEDVHVWRTRPDGGVERLSNGPGVHTAGRAGDLLVFSSVVAEEPGTVTTIGHEGGPRHTIASFAAEPALRARPEFARVGTRRLATAIFLPDGHEPGVKLPVLLDPYGGPGSQRVIRAHNSHLTSQWLADQGFAVVVVDGRGTPGRGPRWEREIARDLATKPLEDQVDAVHAVAETHTDLDLDRVAIRGWSFGGFLAALAVLRRPDVFKAAVAGAPVTDWCLYDTHYTERYLGHPDEQPTAYAWSSLLDDAPKLERPLLLIHGLADDNVVAAHTLQLSSALLAAGRPHTVLPLSGVTHMTPQEVVAENLLLLQVAFLKEALAST